MAETRESLSKRIAKIKERKKNNPNYPQAAINKELKLLEDQLAKLPTRVSPALGKPKPIVKATPKAKGPERINTVRPWKSPIITDTKSKDFLAKEKLKKEQKKLAENKTKAPVVKVKAKGPERINTVRPWKSPIITDTKSKDFLAKEKLKKEQKKLAETKPSSTIKNVLKRITSEKKVNAATLKRDPDKSKSKEFNKFKKGYTAKSVLDKPITKPKNKKPKANNKKFVKRIEKALTTPIKKPVSIKTTVKKGPARTVYDAQDRGLDTFTNKKGKVLAAITKEQLAKSGKGLTPLLNAQKKSGKSLTKYLKSEGIIEKSKPTTKKMGGGKVYRRGGGKALRGFGKATYSNKLY